MPTVGSPVRIRSSLRLLLNRYRGFIRFGPVLNGASVENLVQQIAGIHSYTPVCYRDIAFTDGVETLR